MMQATRAQPSSPSRSSATRVADAVVSLDDPGATDPQTCGHKAATLARLRQEGLDVPPGFVILAGRAGKLDEATVASLLEALPGPVAVRSSAVAEDLPDASFAGQYETVLDVQGPAAVLAAVRKCVASGSSERVQAYDAEAEHADDVAVLVQAMVHPDAAGVVFSANPTTGDRSEALVSAVAGLADALVGGEVGGETWKVRGDQAEPSTPVVGALSPGQARRVAALAADLQQRLGAPQDVEWALQGERLAVLQSRPITALPIEPEIHTPQGTWQKDTAHYPGPVTPFGASIFAHYDAGISAMIEQWGLMPDAVQMKVIGHEVYSRTLPDDGGKAPPPWWLLGIVARLVPSLRRKLARAREVIERGRLDETPPRWEAEWKPQLTADIERFAEVDLTALDDDALLCHFDELTKLAERAVTIHMELFVPYLVGAHELVQTCQDLLGWPVHEAMTLLQGASQASSAPTRALRAVAELARDRPQARAVIEAGGPRFFEKLRAADPEVAEAMDRYLRRWGLRTIAYDAGTPTLGEQPSLVASLLAELFDASEPVDLEAARSAAVAKAREQLRTDGHRARFDAALAYAEQVYPLREDNILYTDNLPSGLMRRYALEAGRRLRERGLLSRRTDAVYLSAEQIEQALRGKLPDAAAIATRTRGEMAWVRANPGPLVYGPAPGGMPDIRGLPEPARRLNGALLWAMQQELRPAAAGEGEGEGLRGQPASPGVATGRVRVIPSSDEIHRVRPGDVVVCPTTTPSWTVIFQRAAALVTDGGSPLSHAAIVAREHGIPAVVGTGNATTRLSDGQRVTVDGNQGLVVASDS